VTNASQSNKNADLVVLYEDNHCLAVLKPAGVLTMGDKTGDETLLEMARRYIKHKYRKPGNVYLGVVHRLDRPVSGVVLFARTSKAAARLSEQFRSATVRKLYWACVEGRPNDRSGTLEDRLVKDRKRNVVTPAGESDLEGGRSSAIEYRVIEVRKRNTLLKITPLTGRSHQIRVQLASRGMPIVGDKKYGAARAWGRGRIALHAAELEFEHPVKRERIRVTAPAPGEWDKLLT
jgi:23S rRNA pseudouridine1911/1915/1917 synthase